MSPITRSILSLQVGLNPVDLGTENQITINMEYNIIYAERDRRVSVAENQITYF